MARPPAFPAEEKVRIVLSILAGEVTVAEAARRAKVSEQSVGNWKRQFLESGRAGLVAGKSGPSTREAQLEAEGLAGRPLVDLAERDEQGNVVPLVTIVTDNGGPFRSFRFEAFIATHPELRHVRTRVKTPGQNGSRERGFGSLKYEKLFLEEIPDALDLVAHAEDYRVEYNTVRPHEALAWNRPRDVHLGLADPLIPNFPETEDLPAA